MPLSPGQPAISVLGDGGTPGPCPPAIPHSAGPNGGSPPTSCITYLCASPGRRTALVLTRCEVSPGCGPPLRVIRQVTAMLRGRSLPALLRGCCHSKLGRRQSSRALLSVSWPLLPGCTEAPAPTPSDPALHHAEAAKCWGLWPYSEWPQAALSCRPTASSSQSS